MAGRIAVILVALAPSGAEGGLRGASMEGPIDNRTVRQLGAVDASSGSLRGSFVLSKRFDLDDDPSEEFDIEEIPDSDLTHSCSNYINDNSTVFSRDGKLVLKVASHCDGGGCLNSGRVMSKESFKYGLFTFSAKVPKCNYIWPALWLLPNDVNGEGAYGRWPCSGEIDVLETVHDQSFGAFNLVQGYGSSGGCAASAETVCNQCVPGYCTSTTMDWRDTVDRYFVEETDCDAEHPTWEEHLFVLSWQPDQIATWVDPTLSYDASGRLVGVTPKAGGGHHGEDAWKARTWKAYQRESTPKWKAVEGFFQQCFPDSASHAPYDDAFKIVLNIAVGGYGGAPCNWGWDTCSTTCGGAVGSELVLSDISVWQLAV